MNRGVDFSSAGYKNRSPRIVNSKQKIKNQGTKKEVDKK